MTAWVVGLDIGGTKIAGARVSGDGGLRRRTQVPTPTGSDPEAVWAAVQQVVDEVVDGARPAAVGIGCGGPMRWPDGVVSPLNIPGWREFPLRDRLRDQLAVDVVVHNDAAAMAVGEQRFGAGRGASSLLGVVVSTGVGGGLVLDGRVVDGPTGNAGHIGHVVVDPAGPDCACGGRGCLEAVARGPALVAWAQQQGWQPETVADGRALVASARSGDPVAIAALTRAGRALGVALASAAALVDLDRIVVGGGIVNAGGLLLGPARAAYERHAQLSFTRDLRIEAAALGGDAGVVGAAVLAFDSLAGTTQARAAD